jgi:glycosyltransferase involved in cell wall biosynthesis
VSSKARILFLSHAASRNGATILLLHILRWLKDKSEHQFEVLVNGRGELLGEFQELCPTRVWRNPANLLGSLPPRWRAKMAPRLASQMLKVVLGGRRYDLVHVNTAATWQHVPELARRSGSLLWHIHELSYGLRTVMGNEAWRQTFPLAKRFVAVSQAVRETLINEFEVPGDKIDLVHGFIPVANLSAEEKKAKRDKIRKELGVADDVFLVGGCGTLGWRKGTDLFLQITQRMASQGGAKCASLWVGGSAKGEEALQFEHDMRVLGLGDRCKWVPNTANVSDYYYGMDVFALTSREDPFPLVMLEAGAAGLPVVCFAGSGGGAEFVGRNAGLIAPYADVEAFARDLLVLQSDANLRNRLGAEAARRVMEAHIVEKQAPLLLKSLERCMGAR